MSLKSNVYILYSSLISTISYSLSVITAVSVVIYLSEHFQMLECGAINLQKQARMDLIKRYAPPPPSLDSLKQR
jgi:hypothetical protein